MIADYYELLNIPSSATPKEIRSAYRKCALATHPDRFASGSRQQDLAHRKFQKINDAYYTLSDPQRRKDYDRAYNRSDSGWTPQTNESESRDEGQFANAFEDILGEEGNINETPKTGKFGILGAIAGSVLGYIIFNIPGALSGAAFGKWLGSLRDSKGKSVYQIFSSLPQAERAALLAQVAKKMFDQAT